MPATTPPLAINQATLPAPSGYSHGTLAGNTLHLGGQTALDAEMKIVPGGPQPGLPLCCHADPVGDRGCGDYQLITVAVKRR